MLVICKILECGLYVRPGGLYDLGMWVICHTWECDLGYARSWSDVRFGMWVNLGIWVNLGMWVMCKILECGLYVIPWNVGYM